MSDRGERFSPRVFIINFFRDKIFKRCGRGEADRHHYLETVLQPEAEERRGEEKNKGVIKEKRTKQVNK